MGDRVLIQFKTAKGEVSPVIYGHWAGEAAPAAIARLYARMRGRRYDLPYIAARCLQELGMTDERSTSFGIWNVPPHGELDPGDAHGDAGCFVVTVGETWHVQQFNGYAPTVPNTPGITWECVAPA